MTSLPPEHLEEIALEACRAAADVIRQSVERSTIATKSTPSDIVTATDLTAERAIRDLLAVRAPGSLVLGEEGGHAIAGTGDHDDIEWVVDPIDGTVNFAYRLPVTAVSVAAVGGGRPMAGAVIDVDRRDEYSGCRGGGARRNGEPVEVSSCSELALALVATGFPYDAGRRTRHGLTVANVVGQVRDVRGFGSAALHLCWVATGQLDGYVERDIKPWDHAAGALIALEAGATVELPCAENDHLVLVANPVLHGMLRAIAVESADA